MTRRRRAVLIYSCLVVAIAAPLLLFWTVPNPTSATTPATGPAQRVSFGILQWISVEWASATAGTRGPLHWEAMPAALGFNVVASVLWVGLVLVAGRWLTNNSGSRQWCAECDYPFDSTSTANRCPECGEMRTAESERRAISPHSFRLLVVALMTMGASGAVLSIAILHQELVTALELLDIKQPQWMGGRLLADLRPFLIGSLLAGGCMLLTWFYLEPTKHRHREVRTSKRAS